MINVNLKPHDLRRHAATYASRSGVPIEIVSKIILRHANLATTHKDTLEKLVIRKQFIGLIIFTDKILGDW